MTEALTGFFEGLETTEKLTTCEREELTAREAVIDRGLKTFVEVGTELLAIRDGRLYREQGTFEDYCRMRWGMTHRYANYMIEAAGVVNSLGTMVPKPPETERQTRPLTVLPPDQQPAAWNRAQEIAKERTGDGKVTAAIVSEAVKEIRNPEVTASNYYKRGDGDRTPDDTMRQPFDHCQTPAYAVDPLLPYLPVNSIIWEPARGEGFLVDALFDAWFEVVAGDITTGENFFDYEPAGWDILITNPPYSLKYRWLERCYALGKPFALLLPVETLGAKTAQKLFKANGVQVILLDKRINFKMPFKGWDGSSPFPTAWFTWGLNLPSDLTFATLEVDENEHR